jgi:hypothetical protein
MHTKKSQNNIQDVGLLAKCTCTIVMHIMLSKKHSTKHTMFIKYITYGNEINFAKSINSNFNFVTSYLIHTFEFIIEAKIT